MPTRTPRWTQAPRWTRAPGAIPLSQLEAAPVLALVLRPALRVPSLRVSSSLRRCKFVGGLDVSGSGVGRSGSDSSGLAGTEHVALMPRIHVYGRTEAPCKGNSGSSCRSSIRTGRRCTTLTQLPVAFSAGSSENCEPVPGLTLTTLPSNFLPG